MFEGHAERGGSVAPVAHSPFEAPAPGSAVRSGDAAAAKDFIAQQEACNVAEREVSIGAGTSLTGELKNCERVVIHGTFEGNIEAETFVVLQGGSCKGNVKTMRAVLHGSAEGNLWVVDHVHIGRTGRFEGELDYGQLAMEAGGTLAGQIRRRDVGQTVEVGQVHENTSNVFPLPHYDQGGAAE